MSPDAEPLRALAVALHGRRVGVINRIAPDRYLFAFEQDYLDDSDRSTLSLSFKTAGGGVRARPRAYPARVPPFFSNLLPEGHLRDYLARRAGVKPGREFFLLHALGADLPGAVSVEPFGAEPAGGAVPDGDLQRDSHDEARPREAPLRFSLAGVQLKFSAIAETSGGLTIPADGAGGSWIVKLPSTQFSAVPENEFTMLELARCIGIAVPPIRLVSLADIEGLPAGMPEMAGKALAIERFDRKPGGERVHMEDFAQVFGLFPQDKYGRRSFENIGAVLWAETGEDGTWEFLRRLTFSVVIGNGDMHLKNWSLLYPDTRTPVLSPAYDLVATVPYIGDDDLALGFGGTKSLAGITRDRVRRFADRAGLPVSPAWQIVRETADATAEAWSRLDARDVLPSALRRAIDNQIARALKGTES